MVISDDRAKKGAQLSLIEKGCDNKESKLQLRSRYDQFISSRMLLSAGLKCINSSNVR